MILPHKHVDICTISAHAFQPYILNKHLRQHAFQPYNVALSTNTHNHRPWHNIKLKGRLWYCNCHLPLCLVTINPNPEFLTVCMCVPLMGSKSNRTPVPTHSMIQVQIGHAFLLFFDRNPFHFACVHLLWDMYLMHHHQHMHCSTNVSPQALCEPSRLQTSFSLSGFYQDSPTWAFA